jgi:hypothetical protein
MSRYGVVRVSGSRNICRWQVWCGERKLPRRRAHQWRMAVLLRTERGWGLKVNPARDGHFIVRFGMCSCFVLQEASSSLRKNY